MRSSSTCLGAKSSLAVASSDRDVASSVQVRYAARVEAQLAILCVLFTWRPEIRMVRGEVKPKQLKIVPLELRPPEPSVERKT